MGKGVLKVDVVNASNDFCEINDACHSLIKWHLDRVSHDRKVPAAAGTTDRR